MNKFFSFLCLSLFCLAATAQTDLNGIVVELADSTPVPYATVRLYAPTTEQEATAIVVTDVNGRFSISTKRTGEARLVVSVVGAQPAERSVTLSGQAIDLGFISIQPADTNLGEATVTAARPIVRMEPDKVGYDLQADPDTKSATLLEMLRKVPLVTVDGNDNIQVAGNSNFKVYVDGKPQPMFNGQNASLIMKSIPASYATEIEVITNPGARYDAEGTGGIINIKTAMAAGASAGQGQSLDGYSLNLNTHLTHRGQRGSANFIWQKNKFSLNANVGVGHMKPGKSQFDFDRIQHTDIGDMTSLLRYDNALQNNMTHASLNLSYQIDSLRLLTAGGNMMFFNQHNDGIGTTNTTLPDNSHSSYAQRTRERTKYTDISANIDYQRSFAGCKERFLTLSYQFNHTPLHKRGHSFFSDFVNIAMPLIDRYSDDKSYTTEHTAQADFTTPLAEGHTLSLGGKFIGRTNNSDATLSLFDGSAFIPDALQSTLYKHYNDIGAAYAEYEGSVGKFKLKAGARYEHTWQRVRHAEKPENNFSLNYGNLVPSATLTYQMAPTQSLGMTYKMRITRPFIQELNPYVNTTDPTSISYGNPELEAEKTNAIGLVYSNFSGILIIRAQAEASFTSGSIEEYSFYKDNVLNTTYGNIGSSTNAGFNLFVNLRPSMNTSIMLNGGTSYIRYNSHALAISNHGWQCNLMLGLQQTLWWKLKLSLNLFTNSRSIQLQGTNSGFSAMMGTLTRSFFKNDMLTLGIGGFMPLQGTSLKFRNVSHGANFSNRMSIRIPVAQIGITATLKLGKMGLSTRSANRSIENTDGSNEMPNNGMGSGMGGMMGM